MIDGMKAYSLDLRERILMAVDAGTPKSEVARTFRVHYTTVQRYVAQRRDTGSLAPKPHRHRAPLIKPEQYETLRGQLEAAPDAILAEHCETWERTQGVHLAPSTMHRTLARLGWTRKKRR